MKRKRYTEEQIISILKEHEAGAWVPDLARRHGVAENTVYRWKSKFGGMEVQLSGIQLSGVRAQFSLTAIKWGQSTVFSNI